MKCGFGIRYSGCCSGIRLLIVCVSSERTVGGLIAIDLEDECRQCGKSMEEADGIAPVAQGWHILCGIGPEWSCYECMGIDIAEEGGTGE